MTISPVVASQFCTNPGLLILLAGEPTEKFLETVVGKFKAAPVGTLLSAGVAKSLSAAIDKLQTAGAKLLVGGESVAELEPFSLDRFANGKTFGASNSHCPWV